METFVCRSLSEDNLDLKIFGKREIPELEKGVTLEKNNTRE